MPKIVDSEQQRREISAQAARWIATRGLETLSLRNVAKLHGCSKGMVQHYFADKEELLFGALLHVTAAYEEREKVAVVGYTGLEKIEHRFLVILPVSESLRDEWVVRLAFYARAALAPKMQAYLHDHVSRALRVGTRELRDAQLAGEVARGVNLARSYRVIMATVAGIAVSEVVSPGVIAPAVQKRMLRDAISVVRSPPAE
jgi:AcrR family transcriptional regulator